MQVQWAPMGSATLMLGARCGDPGAQLRPCSAATRAQDRVHVPLIYVLVNGVLIHGMLKSSCLDTGTLSCRSCAFTRLIRESY